MSVKLVLLMNLAIVANCQSTISNRNDVTHEHELFENMKSDMWSIRQLLMNIQQTAVSIERQAMQEMKSEIEEICQTMLKQHGNETQSMQEMNSKIEEIRQIVIQQQYWSRNEQRKTECPVGFDYLPEAGSCFMFVFEEMSWDNATERCRGIMPGVHLAAITSQEENDDIVRYLQSQFSKNGIGSSQLPYVNQYSHGVWISGQRRIPGRCDNPFVWKTLNGIEIPFNYTNWATSEPSCHSNKEPCVHIAPGISHAWNDNGCQVLYFPLCEI